MTNELLERLLYEEESTTLDFKREQYRFVRASDKDKAELLKDILGFANAWRRSEAYILIGVKEVRGARSQVMGIAKSAHLADHSLQQFVNNLTNQPVRFHYEAFGFDGRQVGVIRIEEQIRPIYLRKDFGTLLKEKVYVRRGSSTDPTKPALPDEIAQMRVAPGIDTAELTLEFADVQRDDPLGCSASIVAEFCAMPPKEKIPDLVARRPRMPAGLDVPAIFVDDPLHPLNEDYFRDLADYVFAERLLRAARFVVSNVGRVAATNVHVELTLRADVGVSVLEASDLPSQPRRRTGIGYLDSSALDGLGPAFSKFGGLHIDRNEERIRLAFDCGDLQPGRRVWSEVFYMGKDSSGAFDLRGRLFAGNMPQPAEVTLAVSAAITRKTVSIADLRSMGEDSV